jgi:alkylated DNA nucleotide flippase Atl1
MSSHLAAEATFHRELSEVHRKYADELLSISEEANVSPTGEVAELPQVRGARQSEIVILPGLTTEAGMKTADIAAAIKYEVPNTHQTLQALERAGIVEMIPGKIPQHWRLRSQYRANSETFKRIAELVAKGEWTTYGDISIVVRGDTKAARGVGRAAAMLADFPNPYRILKEGGWIHDKWVGPGGRGPEYCRKLLEKEGVDFMEDGRANPARYVSWFILKERDAQRIQRI